MGDYFMGLFKRKKEDNRPLIEQVFHGAQETRESYVESSSWDIFKVYKADWQQFGEILQKHKILDQNQSIGSINKQLDFDYNNKPLLKVTYELEGNDSANKKTIIIDRYKASVFATRGMGRTSDFMVNELWQDFSDSTIYNSDVGVSKSQYDRANEEKFKKLDNYIANMDREFTIKYGKCKFRYFGYENGIPVFVIDDKRKKEQSVLITTPKELILCVSNLIPEEKLYQARDIEFFKEKCNEISKRTVWESEWENWDIARDLLADYLVKNKKTFAKQIEQSLSKQLEK